MYGTTLTAIRIVGIPYAFKRNVRIEIWFAPRGIERQVVITMPLNVVQHKTSFFVRGTNAPTSLDMLGIGLLA